MIGRGCCGCCGCCGCFWLRLLLRAGGGHPGGGGGGRVEAYQQAVARHRGTHVRVDSYDTYPPVRVCYAEFASQDAADAFGRDMEARGFTAATVERRDELVAGVAGTCGAPPTKRIGSGSGSRPA